jgi:hypothetical protein
MFSCQYHIIQSLRNLWLVIEDLTPIKKNRNLWLVIEIDGV